VTKTNELFLVGLTGKNASGKGEAARLLMKHGYHYGSLSDLLREEIKARNLECSRENLILLGQELRRKFGPGFLATRMVEHLKTLSNQRHVIDSIRNPSEVEILKQTGQFFLLGVDAPLEIRFQRAQARGRNENAQSLSEFKKIENQERSNNPFAQQLDHCWEKVDQVIQNDHTLESLEEKIISFLQKIQFPV
jgi:dephospho-CoA kinase